MMDKWIPVIIAVVGTGGLGTLLAFFFVSPEKRFGTVENSIKTLREEVVQMKIELKAQQVTNRYLTMGVTVLTMHSDAMRAELMRLDPGAKIETASDVLKRVKANVEAMNVAGE